MEQFFSALLSKDRNAEIAKEYDWFASLIGDWTFDYYDLNNQKIAEGEWMFRRVLDGMAIEDLFICPSRETRKYNKQDDAEYGAAIRMFNKTKKCYDMFYTCENYTTALEVHKENDKIVCTVRDDMTNKWVFSEITDDTFKWNGIRVEADGTWKILCSVYACRK